MSLDPPHWARLRPLLNEALELAPEERGAWLAERRREDPALAHELEALLAAEEQLDKEGFLGETGRKEFLSGGSLAGRRIGPYTLVESLGQGGMGSVWLATRADGRFEGEVAIKFLNLALLSPAGEKRFRRRDGARPGRSHRGLPLRPGGRFAGRGRLDRHRQERVRG